MILPQYMHAPLHCTTATVLLWLVQILVHYMVKKSETKEQTDQFCLWKQKKNPNVPDRQRSNMLKTEKEGREI